MNVLLGVYACEPNKGSEPEVGWQMVNEIAKKMPNDMIYAVTKANNREAIEKVNYPSNISFFYYEPPKWLTFWKKAGRGVRTYYYLWLIGASLFIKRKKIEFKIIHHITFVNDWLPSFFYLLKTKQNKFIWGSIGSHDPINFQFLDGTKQKIIESIRISLQLFFRNFDPSFHICKSKADCIIGINNNVKQKLKLKKDKYFIAESAIGMKKPVVENILNSNEKKECFIIISVGRLLYIKNFKLTILSFAKFLKNNPNSKLQIIGEGEDKKSLKEFTKSLGIIDKIEFVGQVSLNEVQQYFHKANLFLFPTLENAGFVTLEAMSHKLPVLAMEYGGPEQFIKSHRKEQLVDSTQDYNDIAVELSKKLEIFYKDKELCRKVGKQNKEDILNYFTWEAKANKITKLYKELINE
jgi:glycosyltransferase involved in cell wall biosynthesis